MRQAMKIQPLDPEWAPPSGLAVATTKAGAGGKSRLKRLFERQFPSVMRIAGGVDAKEKETIAEVEPSSVCLAGMVQSFLEDDGGAGRQNQHARSRCNCFNGNRGDDSSDDEAEQLAATCDLPQPPSADVLKGLVACSSTAERNLLAEATRILEKHKVKEKDGDCRKIVVDGLLALGYDASVCKSTWEKTATFPAGEYEYIDVVLEGGVRVLVDVDFRAQFQIARPARAYRAVAQVLPVVFVGGEERLQQVVALAAEAARQSLKRKGLLVAPWRRYDYLRSKWLGPYRRLVCGDAGEAPEDLPAATAELDLRLVESESGESHAATAAWEPPAVEPKNPAPRGKVVAGLASIIF